MLRWLALGALVVLLTWVPYVYTELGRRSAREEQVAAASDDEQPYVREHAPSASQLSAATPSERPALRQDKPEPTAHEDEHAAPPKHEPDPSHDAPVRVEALRRAFDEETRDAFWANDQEPELRAALQKLEVPAESLGEASCRRTVCRVTFGAALEPEQESAVLTRLAQDFGAALFDAHDGAGDKQPALYVLRAGYKAH